MHLISQVPQEKVYKQDVPIRLLPVSEDDVTNTQDRIGTHFSQNRDGG